MNQKDCHQIKPVIPIKPKALCTKNQEELIKTPISPSVSDTLRSPVNSNTTNTATMIATIENVDTIKHDLPCNESSDDLRMLSLPRPLSVRDLCEKFQSASPGLSLPSNTFNPSMTRLASARVDELSSRRRLSEPHNTPRRKQAPPPLPPKTWKTHPALGDDAFMSTKSLQNKSSLSSSITTTSFASDLSSCLYNKGSSSTLSPTSPRSPLSPVSPTWPTSPTIHSDELSARIRPRPAPLSLPTPSPNALAQHFSTQLRSSPSTLHIAPAIPRSTTGTRVNSQITSFSTATRARQYGSALTHWLRGSSDDDSARRARKDSITIISKAPVICTSPTSLRPVSFSSYCSLDDLPSSPTSPPPSSISVATDTSIRRFRIIQELLETEKAYHEDMKLVKEVYYDPAIASHSPLTQQDVRRVFSNLLGILELEDEFVPRLEMACQSSCGDDITIGGVFRDMMEPIANVYAEFCKRHQDGIVKLQELENRPDACQFLKHCETRMQGRTTCWDLGSLLIKPVQRVLKYPLLLRALCACTPVSHPDHPQLVAAAKGMEQVAEHINETKLRKDMVEKIVHEKKKPEFKRLKPSRKIGTAVTTRDMEFDTLHAQFQRTRDTVHQLARDIHGWVRRVKDHFEHLAMVSNSFDAVYSSSGGVRVKSLAQIREWHHLMLNFPATVGQELDAMMQGHVHDRIHALLQLFENPSEVIHRRAQSLLDYDRVQEMKAKGAVPDKQLQASADAYDPINAQLLDELPKFLQLANRYIDVVIGELARVQSQFMAQVTQEWQKLGSWPTSTGRTDGRDNSDNLLDEVIRGYLKEMVNVQEKVDEIDIINIKRKRSSILHERTQELSHPHYRHSTNSSRSNSSSSSNSTNSTTSTSGTSSTAMTGDSVCDRSSRRWSGARRLQRKTKIEPKDDMDGTPSLLSAGEDGIVQGILFEVYVEATNTNEFIDNGNRKTQAPCMLHAD
ncbi:hypothetical protein EC973_009609 [Apophysomyces ossiformis]|uniref:Scaffold protein Tuba n=1 Tax=Apophysomyces ossiformis TaxID=679940 RepID=A0A8H7BLZ9_9FUNG|nr:hypothetical protein EC973_009609 [Apophysomyces ossiformis]